MQMPNIYLGKYVIMQLLFSWIIKKISYISYIVWQTEAQIKAVNDSTLFKNATLEIIKGVKKVCSSINTILNALKYYKERNVQR